MDKQRWLSSPNLSWRWIVGSVVFWSFILIPMFNSPLRLYLDAKLSQPVQFRFRNFVGLEPPISDKIKVYGIDDKTFAKMDSWVLSTDLWARIFRNIARAKPRAIVVDAVFSKIVDPEGRIANAIKILNELDTPIVVGSFTVANKLRYRVPLDMGRADFNIQKRFRTDPGPEFEAQLPPMMELRQHYVYGPAEMLARSLKHIGHILYNVPGRAAALIRLDDNVMLPHMSLFVDNDFYLENRKLYVNDHVVPIDANGHVVPNFRSNRNYYRHSKSMTRVIDYTLKGREIPKINAGDIVYIMPLMYTGNTDFKPFPSGNAPGGFLHISMMDSVLTGRWLKPMDFGGLVVLLMILFGASIGAKVGQIRFFGAMAGLTMVYVFGCLYIFSSLDLIIPWLLPTAGFWCCALTVFARKIQQSEKKARILRGALEGAVAEEDLKKLLKNPEQINLEARERVVSLVFIDVVGFSKLAEDMLPRMAFDNLASMLARIGDTIHEHGGIIDRTLGDGLLAYFGYSFDEDRSTPNHAEQALRCMIEIQEDNLARNIAAANNGEQVYPLRIGLNTASCYLGNLGNTNRIDFTVVGNGVNFAKRLEGACEMHSVLVGSTTYDLIKGIDLNRKAITKRFIRIKHHSELVESYEYDPFYDRPDMRYAALEGFRKCANIERIDQRWPVHDPSKIHLNCDYGDGQLINFSHKGFSIRLQQPLAKGTPLNVTIDAGGGVLASLLEKHEIKVLQGEVRWHYDDGDGHVHGMMFTNITDDQSDFIVQYLVEFAFSTTGDTKQDESQAS